MIRKVYEVDSLICPTCGGQMRVIAFITDYSAADRIINHLKLTFHAERLPPPRVLQQELLMAAEERGEYTCNYARPHQALDYLTPAEYHKFWLESQRPKRH